MTTTPQERIYDYLIEKGNTNAENAMFLATLGGWMSSKRIKIDKGIKLSNFIEAFPRMFALTNDKQSIYAIAPNFQDDDDDYDKTQGEGSLLSTKVPYIWNRDDFQSSSFVPHYPIGYNVAAIRAPPARYNDGMGSPFFVKASQEGGKRKSKCRNAYKSKSRTARKSRSRRNRNRRSKSKSRK